MRDGMKYFVTELLKKAGSSFEVFDKTRTSHGPEWYIVKVIWAGVATFEMSPSFGGEFPHGGGGGGLTP